LTLREQISFWCDLQDHTTHNINEILEQAGLSAARQQRCRALSAGQKRRAALIRLLIQNADLWLLDEAYAGLDQQGMTWLLSLIAKHRAKGGMVIASVHGAFTLLGAQEIILSSHTKRDAT
jgi:heme exporter protein A